MLAYLGQNPFTLEGDELCPSTPYFCMIICSDARVSNGTDKIRYSVINWTCSPASVDHYLKVGVQRM